jgi:hypothetical protein
MNWQPIETAPEGITVMLTDGDVFGFNDVSYHPDGGSDAQPFHGSDKWDITYSLHTKNLGQSPSIRSRTISNCLCSVSRSPYLCRDNRRDGGALIQGREIGFQERLIARAERPRTLHHSVNAPAEPLRGSNLTEPEAAGGGEKRITDRG